MIELAVNNLCKHYGAYKIFENVNFEIKTKERVGLLGRNGVGKTTIMKILMGKEDYEGSVSIRKGVKLGYLDQIPQYSDSYTAMDVLHLAFEEIYDIKSKMSNLELEMTTNLDDTDRIMKDYGELQQKFELLGGYEIDEKLSKVAKGLNISDDMLQNQFSILSGGEKSRIVLGKILLESPEILLLDEPSNHLDLKSVEWLEGYLKDYKGSVLVISHDRYFLDSTVQKIIELDNDGIETYNGNYSFYLEEKERRYQEAMKHFMIQQKKIDRIEKQIKRFRIWGAMRDSEVMYKRAKELEKRLEKIDRLDKPSTDSSIKINYGTTSRSAKEIVIVKELKKSFDNKLIFDDLNLNLLFKDKLTILGDNGSGKSTLLKIIMGQLTPDKGEVKIGSRAKIGYLPQEVYFDDDNNTVLDEFQRKYNITIGEARNELAKVLFVKDDVFKKISTLSGGEKSRLKICMLMYEQVNLLILDEPTNHLDIDSREILEHSLEHFEGTILIVSHDRYFINKVSNKIAEINNNRLNYFDGNYEYYKAEKEKEELKLTNIKIKQKVAKKNKTPYVNTNKDDQLIKKLNKKISDIETKIEIMEEKNNELESEMFIYSDQADKLLELSRSYNKNKSIIDELMEEWDKTAIEIESYKIQ